MRKALVEVDGWRGGAGSAVDVGEAAGGGKRHSNTKNVSTFFMLE